MNKRIQWEYKEEILNHRGPICSVLHELGKEGWEMCGIRSEAYATAYFKRPIIRPNLRKPVGKKSKYKQ